MLINVDTITFVTVYKNKFPKNTMVRDRSVIKIFLCIFVKMLINFDTTTFMRSRILNFPKNTMV